MRDAHHHFSRAAASYTQAGGLQEQVAGTLARFLPNIDYPRVLEIGCGTGFLSRELCRAYGGEATYILTDLAEGMIASCRRNFTQAAHFIRMDGQRPAVKPAFDVIASSMTIQWFDDPAKSLYDLQNLLVPGGELLYATIGSDNFPEWRKVLRRHHIDSGMRGDLPTFLPGQFHSEMIERNYGSARGFLDMLKETGAGKPKPGYEKPSPRAFKAACDEFDGKVHWHIVYGRLNAVRP
jgi:malonyl-CoA O-methyltransferase